MVVPWAPDVVSENDRMKDDFFNWRKLAQAGVLTTALYMPCTAREPEDHVPEWHHQPHRARMADWPSPVIPASGYFAGGRMF